MKLAWRHTECVCCAHTVYIKCKDLWMYVLVNDTCEDYSGSLGLLFFTKTYFNIDVLLPTTGSSHVTFSVSVETWMALGMSRAVFSFVIEQISLSRTVSCRFRVTYLDKLLLIQPSSCAEAAYQCFPAEDVAVKADPVLREVESPLQEDVPLKSAGVVWSDREWQSHRSVPLTSLGMYFKSIF